MKDSDGAIAPARDVQAASMRRSWIFAAVFFGLLLVDGIREGGFWLHDAFVMGAAALVLLVTTVVVSRLDRRSAVVVTCVLLLAAWWLIRAAATGSLSQFLPLGASMLAFTAAFATTRILQGQARQVAALGVACLGAAGAVVGFLGLTFRWFPMAMPAQGLWRLATTLTYSDAAGLVLAVCLMVALGTDLRPWLVRVAVCLCAGGLLATQSRGAYIAFACGCVLVPWRRYVQFVVPLATGVGLGVAAVASSPDSGRVLWLGAVLVVAVSVSAAAWKPVPRLVVSHQVRAVAVVFLLCLLAGAALLVHHEIGLRALAPSDQDRSMEWSSALHQWASAPYFGVGPDRLLVFQAADGTYAHFAHNEYLQIGADAGAVGLALLLACGVAVLRVVRRFDVLSSCASAALVCWVVAGAFDFDWHLTFVGALGGWCVGLATKGRSGEGGELRT
jgi:hypothetical protein